METLKYIINFTKKFCPLGHFPLLLITKKSTMEKYYTCDYCAKNYDLGEIDD